MTARAIRRFRLRLFVLPVLLAGSVFVADLATAQANAQERRRNVLEMLFGPPVQRVQPRRGAEPQRVQRREVRQQRQEPRRQQRRSARRSGGAAAGSAAAAAAVAAPEAVAKSETARDVLVIGDFMASSLARGLTDSLAGNRDVRIHARSEGSSGLVRDDHYDWLAELPRLIDESGAELVAVMIGANDRQAIRVGGASEAVRSDAWVAEYTRRAEALAEIVEEKGLPLVWVGMPAFQSSRMSQDMAFLNDLYRRAASDVGGEFVDIWNGFVNAEGAFITSGPDPAGQPARLRNSDGITMAAAGTAKLAYYAEPPIVSRLGLSVDDLLVSLAPQQAGAGDLPMMERSPDSVRTAPIALDDPRLDGADALLGGGMANAAPAGQSPRERLVLAGAAPEGAPGRADSFNWNGRGAAVSPLTHDNAVVAHGSTTLEALESGASREPSAAPSLPTEDVTTTP